jgi:hypothetical protein
MTTIADEPQIGVLGEGEQGRRLLHAIRSIEPVLMELDDTERFAALNMLLAYDIIGRGGGEETFEYNLSLVARALRDYFGMHLYGDGTLHSSQQQ